MRLSRTPSTTCTCTVVRSFGTAVPRSCVSGRGPSQAADGRARGQGRARISHEWFFLLLHRFSTRATACSSIHRTTTIYCRSTRSNLTTSSSSAASRPRGIPPSVPRFLSRTRCRFLTRIQDFEVVDYELNKGLTWMLCVLAPCRGRSLG